MEKEEKQSPLIREFEAGKKEQLKWYFNWPSILMSFLIAGPLGLILVWFRPRTRLSVKILISVLVCALTFWMTVGAVDYYRTMADYYRQLEVQIKGM